MLTNKQTKKERRKKTFIPPPIINTLSAFFNAAPVNNHVRDEKRYNVT